MQQCNPGPTVQSESPPKVPAKPEVQQEEQPNNREQMWETPMVAKQPQQTELPIKFQNKEQSPERHITMEEMWAQEAIDESTGQSMEYRHLINGAN
eukprot:216104-Ditylum_brightwellii.AAC.1